MELFRTYSALLGDYFYVTWVAPTPILYRLYKAFMGWEFMLEVLNVRHNSISHLENKLFLRMCPLIFNGCKDKCTESLALGLHIALHNSTYVWAEKVVGG